ncbi:MAG: hypothetical protein ACM3JH_10915 [Acidithiobacillales bacterium]
MKNSEFPASWNDAVPDPAGRCRHLRTKMMHVTSEWETRAVSLPSSSASYWCLKTMGPVGPDDGPCDLDTCRSPRGCFEAAD